VGLIGFHREVLTAVGEPVKGPDGVHRNAFDIPRSSLLVQLRRMRYNVLKAQAGKIDRRQDSRHDRSTHSVPIAEMGNFHEVLRKREAEGAVPLRDPLLDYDEVERRRRHQFGNPFRKGDKGGQAMMSDEIDEASFGSGKRTERRRRKGPRRAGSATPSGTDSEASSRETSPAPDFGRAPSAGRSSVPSKTTSPTFRPQSPGVSPADLSLAGTERSGSSSSQGGEEETVINLSNRWSVKLALMKLVKGKPMQAQRAVKQVEKLRGDPGLIRRLILQIADYAKENRRNALAAQFAAIKVTTF